MLPKAVALEDHWTKFSLETNEGTVLTAKFCIGVQLDYQNIYPSI